jgi:DNA-directed RNA polymerase subunit E'/Rpb7
MEIIVTNEKHLENIYFESIIKQRIIIHAKYLNNKINEYILTFLKNKFEGRCISEGYIQENTIEIINKSIGYMNGSRFTGDVTYDILYKAKICNPLVNNIIECQVKFINKLGLLCNNGPITIIVGRQFHNNQKLLDVINVGDIIKVSIIDKKFSLNDKIIEVTARLTTDIINNSSQQNLILGDITNIDDELDDILEKDTLIFDDNNSESKNEDDSLEDFDLDNENDDFENEYDDNVPEEIDLLNEMKNEVIDENDENDENENTLDEIEDEEY